MRLCDDMRRDRLRAGDEREEELAIAQLLQSVHRKDLRYGYRVFSETTNQPVAQTDVDDHLHEKLRVTILLGESPPYREFVWTPKGTWLITRLIVP
jgi:hypothetical protein